MKFVLGEAFLYKNPKPNIPAFQFKEDRRHIKINIHNLYVYFYVYLYVKVIYPILCRLIFPFSSLINKSFCLLISFLIRLGIFDFIFSFMFFMYMFTFKLITKFLVNLNMFRFLSYVMMIHISMRNLDCQLRDFVSKRFKLTANNEQSFIDFLFETIINSYQNFGITDIKYNYWSNIKRKFLSFFLLYEEKEILVFSNKLFLENLFLLVEAIKTNNKKVILIHKEYCRSRFFYYLFLSQRPNIKLFIQIILYVLSKIINFLVLLVLLPLTSLITQFILIPIIQIFLNFFFLLSLFLKEAVRSFFYFTNLFFQIFFVSVWDFFKVLLVALNPKNISLSYKQLKNRIRLKEIKNEKRIIRWLKKILSFPHLMSSYLPTKKWLKETFLERVVDLDIEPTLLNGDDGFLFVHKQKSIITKEVRTYMDSELLDYLVTQKEFKYWEYADEDELDDDDQGDVVYLFESAYTRDTEIMEQDDTDDDDQDGEDNDFWLMYHNYTEYDVIMDFKALFDSLRGFLFNIPGLRYLSIWFSAIWQIPEYINFKFLEFYYYFIDIHFTDDLQISFKGNLREKLTNILIYLIGFPMLGIMGPFMLYFCMKMVLFDYSIPHHGFGSFVPVYAPLAWDWILFLIGYIWFGIIYWYYIPEHMLDEEVEFVEEEMEDTASFYEDFDEEAWDFAGIAWACLLVDVLWCNGDIFLADPLRFLDIEKYESLHAVDLTTKIEEKVDYLFEIFSNNIEYLKKRLGSS